MAYAKFGTMSDAFDYCREIARPIMAQVDGVCWKLFPSGRAEPKCTVAQERARADQQKPPAKDS